MNQHHAQLTESLTNPSTGLTVTGSVSLASWFGLSLPEFIQATTAVYLVLLVAHKLWQMYKEWRDERNKPS